MKRRSGIGAASPPTAADLLLAGFLLLWPSPALSCTDAEADRGYMGVAQDKTWLPTFRNILKGQMF